MKKALSPFDKIDDVSLNIEINREVKTNVEYIVVQYFLEDPANQVLWDEKIIHPERKLELWKSTCFELFFSPVGSQKYWEANVSTVGHWNVFCFDRYRWPSYPNLKEDPLISSIQLEVQKNKLSIQIPINELNLRNSAIDLSVAAILKLKNGNLSYWACSHVKEKPDFHDRESFILKLEP